MQDIIAKLGKENKNCMRTIPPVIDEILIGDVLERIDYPNSQMTHWVARRDILVELWRKCGFTKSLQEIAEESGHEETTVDDCEGRLKDPNARKLAEFLKTIL